jgi:hypothetical protein
MRRPRSPVLLVAGLASIATLSLAVAMWNTRPQPRSAAGQPGTAAALSNSVRWTADAEKPLNREWAEYSTTAHCAVTSDRVRHDPEAFRESTIVAQGSSAYEFVIDPRASCYGARTEIGQALPERADFSESRLFHQGDNRWFSFQVRLGAHFPIHTPHWDVVAQWKQLAFATVVRIPMVTLQVHSGALYLERARGTATATTATVPRRLAIARTRRWARMSVHIKFSTDPRVGLVEVFGDVSSRGMRRLMRLEHFSTLATDTQGHPVPSHARIGIYRSPAITGKARLYFDGYTVATTRAAAEANAFRPKGSAP